MRRLRLPASAGTSPVGAASLAASLATVIVYVLNIYWPWFHHLPSAVQAAISFLLIYVLAYLGGWLRIVLSPGQSVITTLSPSPLPVLESTPTQTLAPVAAGWRGEEVPPSAPSGV